MAVLVPIEAMTLLTPLASRSQRNTSNSIMKPVKPATAMATRNDGQNGHG